MNYRQNVIVVRGAPSRINRVMTLVRNKSRAVERKRAASSSNRAACGGSSLQQSMEVSFSFRTHTTDS